MRTSQLNFNVADLTNRVGQPAQGISFVEGITKRGPISDPSEVITSFAQFQRIFGGLIDNSDFPLLCKTALDKGAALRVNRVAHYTDITDAGTLSATKAAASGPIVDGANNIFLVAPKYHGVDYNNLEVEIKAASNGSTNYFNMEIRHTLEPDLNEEYTNLIIDGTPDVAGSTYLDDVILQSKLIDFTYQDLSALTAPLRPDNATYTFSGGTDGGALVDTDYVGDASARTGFYAFDAFDDAYQICAPEISATNVHIGGAAYAANRKDLFYFAHLPNTAATATDLITQRDSTNIDSPYTMFFAGGVKVLDPVTSQEKEISEMGEILAIVANSDNNFGEWYSAAGPNRGAILGILGVVNNFGSPASLADMNLLANKGINKVIVRNNKAMLWDYLTGQLKNTQTQFGNVQRLIMFLQKSLAPTLENYIEEPNDTVTFKQIHYAVKPFLDSLVARRALDSYLWDGDQDAASLGDLQVNDPGDVQAGKYKINFFIKPISALRELQINIIITPAGISFDTANEII